MKPKIKKPPPHAFVLEELADLEPLARPMFGCTALYIGERIVLVLRDKPDYAQDNGVWLATDAEHHASLKQEFPSMRSIELLAGGKPTNWQNLPLDALDFETAALKACALIRAGDPRIGRVPKVRRKALARPKVVR